MFLVGHGAVKGRTNHQDIEVVLRAVVHCSKLWKHTSLLVSLCVAVDGGSGCCDSTFFLSLFLLNVWLTLPMFLYVFASATWTVLAHITFQQNKTFRLTQTAEVIASFLKYVFVRSLNLHCWNTSPVLQETQRSSAAAMRCGRDKSVKGSDMESWL